MIKDRKTSDEVIDMVQRLLLVEDDQSLIDGLSMPWKRKDIS